MNIYNELADTRASIARTQAALKDLEMKGRDSEKGTPEWWGHANEWKMRSKALKRLQRWEAHLLEEIML